MTDRQHPPRSIREIAETIGVRLALKLVQEFGGLEIRFPAQPDDQHPVIRALGKEDGYAICKYMDGSKLSVPHCRPPRSARAEILRMEAEGLSNAEIARRIGITQRWVRKVVKSPPPNQLNMFEET
ncbi:helix-turn-helix domain-containing protein [Shinella sp.]|uniref:helix-turn-helix domain-containing protein n=1 Tax=Shinella sp. TaxID=1870904 RepID=UPI002587C8D7|nr:helix-turn-helix domain-containing protein [Shinella sp.]MCW5711282.1 helix-turn-helix domain-containing protein [Shinella sp.]